MGYELITALITPFNENGTINYKKIKELIEFQYLNGTNGLLILGTTSESSTLSEEEKENIIKYVIKENNNRMEIIAGVIENSTQNAIIKSLKYKSLGVNKLLVISPFYNKTNNEGMIQHFTKIAQAVDIPIILYNVPSRTGVNIDLSVIRDLMKVENIIGIKEASKDINHITQLAFMCNNKFSLYCGNDDLLLTFLSLNCKGIISVVSNIKPDIIYNTLKIYEINPLTAFSYYKYYYDFICSLFIEVNPMPIKAIMNFCGIDLGVYRLPLTKISAENYLKIINIYTKTFKF